MPRPGTRHQGLLAVILMLLSFALLYTLLQLPIAKTALQVANAIDEQSAPSERPGNQPAALPPDSPEGSSNVGESRKTDSLVIRLGELRAKLATLSAQYTPLHPDVIEVKRQIADLRARLEAGSENDPNASARLDEIRPRPDVPSDIKRLPDNAGTSVQTGTSVQNGDIVAEEKAELTETARLLAVLLDSGRVVVGRAQTAINNPRLEGKGFSSAVFEDRLRKEFLARTGHDLRNLAPAQMPERAKVLLVRLAFFMQKSVQEAQPLINQKGIGFKGFIPATFATRVAETFSKDTGLTLKQIGPPKVAPRNPSNKPDEKEEAALLVMQKSHPRVGDHIIEQQVEDRGMRILLPLFYTKQCLACHGMPKGQVDISGYEKEGFKEGDIGGAISVMVPVENPLLKADTPRR